MSWLYSPSIIELIVGGGDNMDYINMFRDYLLEQDKSKILLIVTLETLNSFKDSIMSKVIQI